MDIQGSRQNCKIYKIYFFNFINVTHKGHKQKGEMITI